MSTDFLADPLAWPFPAERVHGGIPLGNGTFGALIWGDGAPLRITVNRADYWDHHGGLKWSEEASYARLRECLERGDEAELRRVFEGRGSASERPARPTRLPMGRVDLAADADASVQRAALDMAAGEASLVLLAGGAQLRVRCLVPREEPALAALVEGPGAARLRPCARPVDAPDVLRHLRGLGYPDPSPFGGREEGGWVQERPAEPALAVAWRRTGTCPSRAELFVCAAYGPTPEAAVAEARGLLDRLQAKGYDRLADETATWWRRYWRTACRVSLPERDIELLYYLGMYKLAGLSMPGTPAATLQGPWVEEHQLPPWAGDYHFNINVQECYWPCYGGNHPEALQPLVKLLDSWKPKLREYARCLTGRTDGLMLPHAVDDRCTCMGGFWTGSVDHGSTAWVGQLLWLYYRYTLDRDFLAATAYPFLKGAMRVFEAMLDDSGEALALPVSVSPEFGGAGFQAWGRNASFQLAAIHWLCRALVEASETLSVDADDRETWRAIDRRLPVAAVIESAGRREIGVWEGRALDESHRHHSHLAGVYPFDVFDYHGSHADRSLVENSMQRWTRMGMGLWTGWAMPWASILCARTARPETAVEMLRLYRRAFMNEGFASLHDARFPGLTVFWRRRDLMQIEAALAAAAAVLELLAHTAQGVLHLFAGAPAEWADASFENLRVEGACLVSAERRNRRVEQVRIRSEAGGALRIANPWAAAGSGARLVRGRTAETLPPQPILTVSLEPGEEAVLLPA